MSEQNAGIPVASSKSLFRATLTALAIAALALVVLVLPAEYGIDPTNIGRVLGLTQMGEIKRTLASEAAADAARETKLAASERESKAKSGNDSTFRAESLSVVIYPGENIEVKLSMRTGDRADFSWTADSSSVYYDMHGHTLTLPRKPPHQYSTGELRSASGEIAAEFDGVHGWYFENRSERVVTIRVKAVGNYRALMEM